MIQCKLRVVIYFLAFAFLVRAGFYNAVTRKIDKWLETQKSVVEDLQEYLKKETRRLVHLKAVLKQYKTEYKKLMKNKTEYIENPLNAFILIKRLTTDLLPVEEIVNKKIKFRRKSLNISLLYPSKKDLEKSVIALWRNQFIYGLNVTQLANGYLHSLSSPLTSHDCFEISQILYEKRLYKEALAWLLEAEQKYTRTNTNHLYSRYEVVKYICDIYEKMGDVKNALQWNKKLKHKRPGEYTQSQIDAADEFRLMKIEHLESQLRNEELLGKSATVHLEDSEKVNFNLTQEILVNKCEELHKRSNYLYRAMCRNEITVPTEVSRRLKCHYLETNNPFLRIARIKAEQLYLSPDVYLFYDVLTDNEIEKIKATSLEKFPPIKTNMQNYSNCSSNRCERMEVLMEEQSDKVLSKVKQRIEHFSGVKLVDSEPFHIMYYDVGGFKAPHYDYSKKEKSKWTEGKRLSTVIFYMSNTLQGGATVFLRLGVTVYPVKGAALYWTNLDPYGEMDTLTCHASCPVLQGSKWVMSRGVRSWSSDTFFLHGETT